MAPIRTNQIEIWTMRCAASQSTATPPCARTTWKLLGVVTRAAQPQAAGSDRHRLATYEKNVRALMNFDYGKNLCFFIFSLLFSLSGSRGAYMTCEPRLWVRGPEHIGAHSSPPGARSTCSRAPDVDFKLVLMLYNAVHI